MILNKVPVFNDLCSLYTGGICHKNFFIFLDPKNCQVDIFNHCLKQVGCIETEKYQSITENCSECYFILTKENDKKCLYKATYDFLEFDSIELHVPSKYQTKINDICYNEKDKQIMIATDNFIYTTTLDGYFVKEISTNLSSIGDMKIYNPNGCTMRTCLPPKPIFRYTAVGICKYLYASYKEHDNSYLVVFGEDNCIGNKICLGKDIEVVSIFSCCNQLYLLVVKNGRYNYLYKTNIQCNDCKEKYHLDCCDHHECHSIDCCEHDCEDECHSCSHFHCCKDPAASILGSVALIETSLSHILNAEGEKIQKAIADDATICELLEINNSVTESIFNVTMLEHVLQNKIGKALEYDNCESDCNDCCKNKCNECCKKCLK